jgi:hypothetical protein
MGTVGPALRVFPQTVPLHFSTIFNCLININKHYKKHLQTKRQNDKIKRRNVYERKTGIIRIKIRLGI